MLEVQTREMPKICEPSSAIRVCSFMSPSKDDLREDRTVAGGGDGKNRMC